LTDAHADTIQALQGADHTIGHRPLVVCDVDEVVLKFIEPFKAFLRASGHQLLLRTFALKGNIFSLQSGDPVSSEKVEELLTAFYDAQEDWQEPFAEARPTLMALQDVADVILLTAMPPRHQPMRQRLLNRFDFSFPLIASEEPKGKVLSTLFKTAPPALIFVDDMLYNCRSVAENLPDALAINLLIDDHYRQTAPQTEPPAIMAASWADTERLIRNHIKNADKQP